MQFQNIPPSLFSPPTPIKQTPVKSRSQILPFDQLEWKDFERLCLRLVRLEADLEGAQCYGEQGDAQEGIDLFARSRSTGKYQVYQCKKVKSFGKAKIIQAISEFQKGEWFSKSSRFVLCTSESLESQQRSEALRVKGDELRSQNIELISWDSNFLSEKLKQLPEIVDDFFGRAWVENHCGPDVSQALEQKHRLDGSQIQEWRQHFRTFYLSLFNRHDPGLPGDQFWEINADSIAERYVFPDITTYSEVSLLLRDERDSHVNVTERTTSLEEDQTRSGPTITYVDRRQAFYTWLTGPSRSVILGDPGSGKSTLLRFIALDLLEESPRLGELAARWGDRLPMWIPFGWWTKKLSESNSDSCSLEELLQSWLKSLNEMRLWPFVEQALKDQRLLLLVDGLDEWANEDTARLALGNLQIFLDLRTSVPAVLTSRPYGFERLQMRSTGWQRGTLSHFTPEQCYRLALYWFMKWADTRPPSEIAVSVVGESEADSEKKLANKRFEWAQKRADEFIAELEANSDFRELSRIPLILCLLIAFRTQNHHLPTGRFDLYDKTINYLIVTHPNHRREASRLQGRPFGLQSLELLALFSYIAFKVQCENPSGVIEDKEARSITVSYLTDPLQRFGLTPREANRIADELLDIGDDVTGLIIRKSPVHVGFFHRALQEYLAASQLYNQDFEFQVELVAEHCKNPQWHEVLLCLFARVSRSSELERFANVIQQSSESLTTGTNSDLPFDRDLASYESAVLLAHLAFGPFATPVHLARKIAIQTFRRIEEESWLPHRERLLRAVLLGLRSTSLRSLVQEKIRNWFPGRYFYTNPIFSALKTWPSSPFLLQEIGVKTPTALTDSANFRLWKLVHDILWRGLHNEKISQAQLAASTMAQLWHHDDSMSDKLAERALYAVNPVTRAAALSALLEFFSTHPQTERAVDEARASLDHELQLVGILGAIKQGRQTNKDRKKLLRLPSERWGLDGIYPWDNPITEAIVEGWPNCQKTKRACLWLMREDMPERPIDRTTPTSDETQEAPVRDKDSEQRRMRQQQRDILGLGKSDHYWPQALIPILIEGYPQDDLVAEWCAKQIELDWRQLKSNDYYQTNFLDSMHGQQWKLIANSFSGHPIVVAALEEWIDNAPEWKLRRHTEWALIGRTPKAKAKLLETRNDGSRPNFDALTAIEGWGADDPEIARAVHEVVFDSDIETASIAETLPKLIYDHDQCRQRLMEILRSGNERYIDSILKGLISLQELHPPVNDSQKDEWRAIEDEIIELALPYRERLQEEKHNLPDPTAELIALFPNNSRVKLIAEEEVLTGTRLGVVVQQYAHQELAHRALEICNSLLPTSLRRLIAHEIREGSGDEAFDLSLLRHYSRDIDVQVSVDMAVGFYSRLKSGASIAQLNIDLSRVEELKRQFESDHRMPDVAQLTNFVAISRETAHEKLRDNLFNRRVSCYEWTIPPYAASLVFDPMVVREFEKSKFHWRQSIGEVNPPLAKTILKYWEQHCSLWDPPESIAHEFGKKVDFNEMEFWNMLAPFIGAYPKARQAMLDWLHTHRTLFSIWRSENVLQCLANIAPDTALFIEYCFDAIEGGNNVLAATLLGQHFTGDEQVLHSLTHKPDGAVKSYYSENVIIALCEGWPNADVLTHIVDVVRSRHITPPSIRVNLSSWSSSLTLQSLKGTTEGLFHTVINLLGLYPFPLRSHHFHFDGAHIMRVLEQRVRQDETLAKMFWTELESTKNPSAKIVLPELIMNSSTHGETVRNWCLEEISKQLNGTYCPEVGFEWKSLSRRPVVHALTDLTLR